MFSENLYISMPRRRGKPRAKREVEKDANQEEHQVEKEDDIFKQEGIVFIVQMFVCLNIWKKKYVGYF